MLCSTSSAPKSFTQAEQEIPWIEKKKKKKHCERERERPLFEHFIVVVQKVSTVAVNKARIHRGFPNIYILSDAVEVIMATNGS